MNSSTTLLAVRFNKFIITVSDGRCGSGRYSRALKYDMVKWIKVGERACVTVSGNMYFKGYLDATLQAMVEENPQVFANIYAKEVVDIVLEAVTSFADESQMTNGVMVAAHGKSGQFEIHWIESKMVKGKIHVNKPKKIQERYFVKGSGETYLNPHMAKIMKACDMDMSEADAIKLVMEASNVAAEGDWGSGGLFRAVIINANKLYEKTQHQDDPPYVVLSESDDDMDDC